MSHDDQTRRAPGEHQRVLCPCFLFGAKRASAGAESRGIRQRFPYQCNKTKDHQGCRVEVIVEPSAASPPEPLAGEDYFCQDNLY